MNTHAHTDADPACHLETFAPAGDFAARAAALRLPPRVWDIALALKSPATPAELAAHTGIPANAVLAALRQLEKAELVSKVLIQFPAVGARHAQPPMETGGQASPATSAAGEGKDKVPPPGPAAAPTVAAASAQPPAAQAQQRGGVRVSLRGAQAAAVKPAKPAHQEPAAQAQVQASPVKPATAAATSKPAAGVRVSLRGAARPEQSKARQAETATKAGNIPSADTKAGGQATAPNTAEVIPLPPTGERGSWLVQPVLDSLRAKAGGDPLVGQLLAYRVFLRVPADLLQAAGIRSVCLIEPDLRINDPRLKAAIEQALREVAGLSWPEPKPTAA